MSATIWILTALLAAFPCALAAAGAPARAVEPPPRPLPYPMQPEAMPRPVLGNMGVTEAGPLLGVADWNGSRFLQYDTLTYWTADGGATWKRKVWMDAGSGKGPRPSLPDARFKSTGRDLYLDGGGAPRSLAVFDPAAGEWRPAGFGDPVFEDITAFACDTGRMYLYSAMRGLWFSGDRGASWDPIPGPGDTLDPASAFDRIEADGKHLLLGRQRPGPAAFEAASTDGGKTWTSFPAPWRHRLFEGCFHWVAAGRLRSECGLGARSDPSAPPESAAVPFADLPRLFRRGGMLYAFADSGVFRQAAAGWERAGGAGDWEGWAFSEDVMSLHTADSVLWISGSRPIPAGIRIRPPRLQPGGKRYSPLPAWLQQGRRVDGRLLPLR